MNRRRNSPIRRLWWRCRLCRWQIDTFGVSHDDIGDRCALGDEVLGHLETRHPKEAAALWVGNKLDVLNAAALFESAGSVRPRKRHVLVAR